MPDSAPVHITTRSGNVRVEAAPLGSAPGELVVDGGTIELKDDGSIHIRRVPSSGWIEVRCAAGTDVTVGTASGKVELSGPLGSVRVATISGKIKVVEAAALDVRTKSGKIEIGTVAGECRVLSKSAPVRVRNAGRATVAAVSGIVLLEHVDGAEVKTISGKVLIRSSGRERISVHTVSGKVEVGLPAATKPLARLRSLSGKIQCECTEGDDVEISVSSVSGAIRVSSH